jgi:hypothetical protein
MPFPVAGKLVSRTGPGLAIQESLYGIIMAMIFVNAAQVGILSFSSNIHLAIVIFSMNFTWGLIDAVVIILIGSLERNRDLLILKRNRENNDSDYRAMIKDDLSGTIVDAVRGEDECRIIDRILASEMESEEELARDRTDLFRSGMASFAITVLTAVPVMMPILFIHDLRTALFFASALGATALFFVGFTMSRYMGANKWRMAVMFMIVGWAVTVIATFMGG